MAHLEYTNQETASSHQRLEFILEGAGLGSWDWWLETNQVSFDRRWFEMLGLDPTTSKHELSTWKTRVHPSDIDQAMADIRAHIEGRTAHYENTHRMRHQNGHWVWILDRGKISARDQSGRPIRIYRNTPRHHQA